ncbi:Ribonuclease P protein component 4 [uncultured archaeon]|nr:Ribonuclease P protein component 4 [uncultured archaeon]
MTLMQGAWTAEMYSFLSPTSWAKSVDFGGAILTENSIGPSQVVQIRRSVDLVRMYSSISGVILKDVVWDGIGKTVRSSATIGFRCNRLYTPCKRVLKVRRKNNATQAKDIARQRMEILFELASLELPSHPERSDRYVQIARMIGTRIRIRMSSQMKKMLCKHCGSYLPASERRVRLSHGCITATCLRCGKQTRIPYGVERPVAGTKISSDI